MEKETQPTNVSELREQIDQLEEKIRQAETAASQKLEEAAPIRSIYKWKAPERIFNPKGRPWYVTVGFITVVVVAYAALTGNYMLILALIMLLMLLYALNTFPPNVVEHEITNKGLNSFGQLYTWNKFINFWVSRRENHYLLNFTLAQGNVSKLIILVGKGEPDIIVQALVKHIDYLNPGGTKQNFVTKYLEGDHIPLTKFYDVFKESEKLNQNNPASQQQTSSSSKS